LISFPYNTMSSSTTTTTTTLLLLAAVLFIAISSTPTAEARRVSSKPQKAVDLIQKEVECGTCWSIVNEIEEQIRLTPAHENVNTQVNFRMDTKEWMKYERTEHRIMTILDGGLCSNLGHYHQRIRRMATERERRTYNDSGATPPADAEPHALEDPAQLVEVADLHDRIRAVCQKVHDLHLETLLLMHHRSKPVQEIVKKVCLTDGKLCGARQIADYKKARRVTKARLAVQELKQKKEDLQTTYKELETAKAALVEAAGGPEAESAQALVTGMYAQVEAKKKAVALAEGGEKTKEEEKEEEKVSVADPWVAGEGKDEL
jgi:hypothetical protein